mgnify:FL=1
MKHIKLFEAFVALQKLNEYSTLEMSYDETEDMEPKSIDYEKWAPVLKAFGIKDMSELVWISGGANSGIPDEVLDSAKSVKDFDLESVGNEDPHNKVALNLLKYKGLLIGSHSDSVRYRGALVLDKDIKKWEKIYKEFGAETY